MAEKKKRCLLTLIGILLLVVTAIIQYAESRISDFENDLVIRQGRLNNLLLYKLEMRLNEFNAQQLGYQNVEVDASPLIPGLNEQRLEGPVEELRRKYEGGVLSTKEYFKKLGNIYGAEYDQAGVRYQTELEQANSIFRDGSPWVIWRNLLWLFNLGLILWNLFLVWKAPA